LQVAAADLLAAHMGREDHRALIEKNKPKPAESLRNLLLSLSQHYSSVKEYAKMAAVRDGIIFGVMQRYNKDLVALFNIVLKAAASAIAQGIKEAPAPAGAMVSEAFSTASDAAISFADLVFEDKSKDLSKEISSRFALRIEIPAEDGRIPGFENVDTKVSTAYAKKARAIMDALSA
jgi:hypothetical protein